MMTAWAEKMRRTPAAFKKRIESEDYGFILLILGFGTIIAGPLGALGAYFEIAIETEGEVNFDWNAVIVAAF